MQPAMLTLGSAHGLEQQQLDEEEGLAAQLVQLRPALCECAAHVAAGRFDGANRCFERILGLASLGDGPLQRLAKIMVDGLVRRFLGPVSRALIDPSSYMDRRAAVREARYSFMKLIPFLKVAYIAINRVILDAMENEKFVHIIDLSGPAAQPWQWLELMRAFRHRPEGPPNLRITVVHDDGEFLADTSARLRKEAESLDMAFWINGFLGRIETLDLGNLHDALAIKSGYARAFSCALQMHRLLAVDDATSNNNTGVVQFQQVANMAQASWSRPGASNSFVHHAQNMMKMNLHAEPSPTTPLSPFAQTPSPACPVVPPLLTRFQYEVRALSPKVLAVVEQEASHNEPDFTVRFAEALHYYAALFDALDDSRVQEERAQVEQILLGEEIKDMLVRDGVERHERHEPLHQWAARMASAGFGAVPLSYAAKMEADQELWKWRLRGGYENRGHENCLLLCRSGRPLYSVSAWRPLSSHGSASVSNQLLPGQTPSTWTWPQQQATVRNFTC